MPGKAVFLAILLAISAVPALADKTVARRPDGTGDPDATTCRPPQPLSQSRLLGPEVCKTNSEWAVLRKTGQDISADGKFMIPDATGKNISPLMNCRASAGGASSGGGMSC